MNIEHQFNMMIREIRKKHVGNGPREMTTKFTGCWAITEMKGILTNVEKFMIESTKGYQVVHEARTTLIKQLYSDKEKVEKLEGLVGAQLINIFTDIDLEKDIAMTIYVFDKPLQV